MKSRRTYPFQPMIIIYLLILTLQANGQAKKPDPVRSSVSFVIRNFGLDVKGKLSDLTGSIQFDSTNLPGSRFSVSVSSTSIQTGNRMRDDHLRKKEYLNVQEFPRIEFISTSIVRGKKAGTFDVTGQLKIKGTEKTIRFPFTAAPEGTGYLLRGSFRINRRDFGVGSSSFSLSDDLTVSLLVPAR
jgi:polyisoprenoid-binding protein YceI